MAIYVKTRYALLIYVILLAIIWMIFYKAGMIHPEPHQPKPHEDE